MQKEEDYHTRPGFCLQHQHDKCSSIFTVKRVVFCLFQMDSRNKGFLLSANAFGLFEFLICCWGCRLRRKANLLLERAWRFRRGRLVWKWTFLLFFLPGRCCFAVMAIRFPHWNGRHFLLIITLNTGNTKYICFMICRISLVKFTSVHERVQDLGYNINSLYTRFYSVGEFPEPLSDFANVSRDFCLSTWYRQTFSNDSFFINVFPTILIEF